MADENSYIGFEELSKKLGGISRTTILRWSHAGKFPRMYHIGRKLVWRISDVEEWLGEQAIPVCEREDGSK